MKHTMTINGTLYGAKRARARSDNACEGCAGDNFGAASQHLSPEARYAMRTLCEQFPCTPARSPTGRDVIWVKVAGPKVTPSTSLPLTPHEIGAFVGTHEFGPEQLKWFRLGEAAHGIKGGA